ncbi:MAG: hypothetical protein OSA93_08620 [Akkermansiaceae bacterium]|nr:hypothetical protein [Akkermansiaceae bacterium]
MTKKTTQSLAAAMGFLALASSAQAAPISFTSALYTDAGVSTGGSLIGAINLGTTDDHTVNTVFFDGADNTEATAGITLGSGVTMTWAADVDTVYEGTALHSHSLAINHNPNVPIVFSGLTIGTVYEIQLMVGDSRARPHVSHVDVYDQATNSGTPEISLLPTLNTTQIVTGRFTADGDQNVLVSLYVNAGETLTSWSGPVNALQIRTVSASSFAITEIEYDSAADPNPTVTLTWSNSGAASYIAKISPDLINWDGDLDDSIAAERDENPDDADHITVTFPLEGDQADAEALFFRIEEE